MNICQAGHKGHIHKQTHTEQGPFWVWDWDTYEGFRGYCTGQDDVSRTLLNIGTWEAEELHRIRRMLDPGDTYLDFGAHIGWFAIAAAERGANVYTYEGDAENLDLLRLNSRLHHVEERITSEAIWIDGEAKPTIPDGPIKLVKIDLEGNEQHAINCLPLERVENIVMEVSPCFNGSYPGLVSKLQSAGLKVEDWDGNWDFHQRNFWLRRTV